MGSLPSNSVTGIFGGTSVKFHLKGDGVKCVTGIIEEAVGNIESFF